MRSSLLFRRWRRVLLTLIPLALALLHVSAAMPLPLLERLDQFIYDARCRSRSFGARSQGDCSASFATLLDPPDPPEQCEKRAAR